MSEPWVAPDRHGRARLGRNRVSVADPGGNWCPAVVTAVSSRTCELWCGWLPLELLRLAGPFLAAAGGDPSSVGGWRSKGVAVANSVYLYLPMPPASGRVDAGR